MHIARTLFALLTVAFFAASANAQEVEPGQVFPGKLLNIRAPESKGWRLLNSSNSGMSFTRPGKAEKESYVAMIRAFRLPGIDSRDGFSSLVAKNFETLPSQFKIISIRHQPIDERGYQCVRTSSLMIDATSIAGGDGLELQWYSLTCRHPHNQDLGFEISFSHRGGSTDLGLEVEALAFIRGVQVPDR